MLSVKEYDTVTKFRMGRTIGPYVPYFVNAFLVDDLLIDTGTKFAREEFLGALAGKEINQIVNTHHHEDHSGNNMVLQKKHGLPILTHPGSLPFLADPQKLNLRLYQRLAWDWPEPSRGEAIPNTMTTENNQFEIIPTPGHCPNHICLYEKKKKWLFTGDIFCGKKIKYFRKDEDFLTTVDTLKKLAALDVSVLFCSLMGVIENGKEALQAKADFMEDLQVRVLDMHNDGFAPKAIRKKLMGSEGSMYVMTGGHYAKQNAVDSIIKGGPLEDQ